jgi:hypothetical protein
MKFIMFLLRLGTHHDVGNRCSLCCYLLLVPCIHYVVLLPNIHHIYNIFKINIVK